MVNHNQKSRTGYLNKNETYYKYKYPDTHFHLRKNNIEGLKIKSSLIDLYKRWPC